MIEDDGTVTKTVNYMDMIPILLCKIQKMQTEIDILKEKLDNKDRIKIE